MGRTRSMVTAIGRQWRLLAGFALLYVGCSVSFYFAEREGSPDLTLADAFWYSLVTVSTVGYGDFYPATPLGRGAGVVLIIASVSLIGLVVSTLSGAVVELRRREALGMNGTGFDSHIVLFGWNTTARVTLMELLGAGERVAVLCSHEEDVHLVRALASERALFVTYGDPSDAAVHERLAVARASTVTVCLDDDALSLIVSLAAREVNPTATIVVALKREELRKSFRMAGVTYVASPQEMGGRLLASAAFEPEVAKFLEDTSTGLSGSDLRQYDVGAGSPVRGRTVEAARADLLREGRALLVAVSTQAGAELELRPNPSADLVIAEGDVLILLGSAAELDAADRWLRR